MTDINKTDQSWPPDAATVILTRETDPGPFEVFLMRRHRKQSFMGNAFVFPGGQLDPADCDPGLAAWALGLTADEARQKLKEPKLPPEKALGLFFAAVRETFEEAGVLLAAPNGEDHSYFQYVGGEARFEAYRLKLHRRELTLKDLAEKEDLSYRLDLLTPYAHWITPQIESKRFDTRFFLARMPRRQVPLPDAVEMTESLWATPAQALARQAAGELLLMPPTLKTMEELARFASVDQLLAAARSGEIRPILPQVYKDGDTFGIILPHDPEYSIAEYKQPARPGEASRLFMVDGRWRTVTINT